MPLTIETSAPAPSDDGAIEIALLNNLADAGLDGGERQFADLLRRAAGPRRVRLRLFALPEIARGPAARGRIAARYSSFETLFEGRLDGLILTGCEPRADRLEDEPYWPALRAVIDRAATNTRSTIFSCLAAHAAVLHLDGIRRQRHARKLSGLYAVEPAGDHALLGGLAAPLQVPHSRWNGLAEADLVRAGYKVLTRGPDVGVDAFVRRAGSLFVFLQGHPEYDAEALHREYRRDVLRYLGGSSQSYPTIPEHCFTPDAVAALDRFAETARRDRTLERFASFPLGQRAAPPAAWNDALALRLFANWLDLLQTAEAEHAM